MVANGLQTWEKPKSRMKPKFKVFHLPMRPPMPVGGQLFLEISDIPDIVYIMMQKCWV